MKAINTLFEKKEEFTFEKRLDLLLTYVDLIKAEQPAKQDTLRSFIYSELAKAKNKKNLLEMQNLIVTDARLNKLFKTVRFFSTDTSAWEAFKERIQDDVSNRVSNFEKLERRAQLAQLASSHT